MFLASACCCLSETPCDEGRKQPHRWNNRVTQERRSPLYCALAPQMHHCAARVLLAAGADATRTADSVNVRHYLIVR